MNLAVMPFLSFVLFSMRIVPHDQNSGGFFVAVIEKSKRLPHEKEPVLKTITPAGESPLQCSSSVQAVVTI